MPLSNIALAICGLGFLGFAMWRQSHPPKNLPRRFRCANPRCRKLYRSCDSDANFETQFCIRICEVNYETR